MTVQRPRTRPAARRHVPCVRSDGPEGAAQRAYEMTDLAAEPYEFALAPEHCALLIIDMQRDFLEPGGFGEMLGNDVSQLRRTIEPNQKLLAAWRAAGLSVLHTREGHRPDLADLPPVKKIRGRSATSRSANDSDSASNRCEQVTIDYRNRADVLWVW